MVFTTGEAGMENLPTVVRSQTPLSRQPLSITGVSEPLQLVAGEQPLLLG